MKIDFYTKIVLTVIAISYFPRIKNAVFFEFKIQQPVKFIEDIKNTFLSKFHYFATVFEISLQFISSINQRDVKYRLSFTHSHHEY